MDKAHEVGTIKIFSALAANAVDAFGVDTRHVSFDTTSVSVYGDYDLYKEAGCFVLITNVPADGDSSYDSRAILRAYKDQYGIEQNFGFLKDPMIVNSVFLKKPKRIEVLGLVLLISLLIWRLVERSMRQSGFAYRRL
ncbi:MAG: hypothetical protein U9Q05_00490, partial [Thermodesulfobacteriota bacterium]|nr:hypothetical protein [Thermodesulfobacteriota bacterium]